MRVSELINNSFSESSFFIKRKDTIRAALKKFSQAKLNILPVVNSNGEFIGSLSLFSILSLVQEDNAQLDKIISPWMESIDPLKGDSDIESVMLVPDAIINVVDQGESLGILSSSDLLRYQREHWQSECELLRIITENIYCGAISIDNTGRIIVYNASAKRIFKLEQSEVIGKNIKDIEGLKDFSKLVFDHNGRGRHKLEFEGTIIIATLTPLMKDDVRIGVLAICHESAAAECISQELYVTEKLLREINIFLESSYDGFFVTDNQGKVIRVNAAWERAFSLSRNEAVGQTVEEMIRKGLYKDSAVLEVLKSKKISTVMIEVKGRKIMATGTPVFNNQNEITTVVVNIRDITELENLKIQLEKQQQLTEQYSSEIKEIRRQQQVFPGIVWRSKKMEQLMDMVTRVAEVDSTVLITGESGVGKEMIAGLLHKSSPRHKGPMIKINCSAIPHTLLESELFGYEAGAFTGASSHGKMGLFELANGGTLLLDEVADTSLDLQVKLLRALQEKEIIKVGGTKPKKVDVRIVAATNRDLKMMIQERTFREDLFYRLNVIRINIPALRERKEDIILLALFFLDKYNKKYRKNKKLSSAVLNMIKDYNWPGNIRELENLIENLVVLAKEDEIIPDDLPESYQHQAIYDQQIVVNGIMPLKKAIELVEYQLIQNAKERFGSTRKIANALEINQSTVVRKMAVQQHR
ncbi:MAG: sigma 54-interacting transcriptional regulator [Dehalobacterium sp.]